LEEGPGLKAHVLCLAIQGSEDPCSLREKRAIASAEADSLSGNDRPEQQKQMQGQNSKGKCKARTTEANARPGRQRQMQGQNSKKQMTGQNDKSKCKGKCKDESRSLALPRMTNCAQGDNFYSG